MNSPIPSSVPSKSGTQVDVIQAISVLQEHISTLQERQEKMLEVLSVHDLRRSTQVSEEGDLPALAPPPVLEGNLHDLNCEGFRHCSLLPVVPSSGSRYTSGPKPAMPSEFDGSRSTGRAFLNSVLWYMRVKGHEFTNVTQMVAWTLSFMKTGRALTFANQVARQTQKDDMIPYAHWKAFWTELEDRFLPVDERDQAMNTLETDQYFQGEQAVDDYCDDFQDLVDHACYTEGRPLVMKFRKGLATNIADQVAMLQGGPTDHDLPGWIKAAKNIARLHLRNEAFNQAVRNVQEPTPT